MVPTLCLVWPWQGIPSKRHPLPLLFLLCTTGTLWPTGVLPQPLRAYGGDLGAKFSPAMPGKTNSDHGLLRAGLDEAHCQQHLKRRGVSTMAPQPLHTGRGSDFVKGTRCPAQGSSTQECGTRAGGRGQGTGGLEHPQLLSPLEPWASHPTPLYLDFVFCKLGPKGGSCPLQMVPCSLIWPEGCAVSWAGVGGLDDAA